MARKVDPEVLAGFLEEARGYLPVIVRGIEAFQANPEEPELLEEAHRRAHTIKGASSMVGLGGLSNMANQLEEALEALMTSERLPKVDATAALLKHVVAQIERFLDGKAGGGLREKPLLEEVARAFEQLRSLPEEDRPLGADDAAGNELGAFVRRLRSLRRKLRSAAAGTSGEMSSVRQPFEELQSEAFRLGRTGLIDTLRRLGLMTEVWECLVAEGPELAEEVATFCDRAIEHVTSLPPSGEVDQDTAWVLHESSSRWGEYLDLLEPGRLAASGEDQGDSFGQADPYESTPAIDANALLRLLTGERQAQPATPAHELASGKSRQDRNRGGRGRTAESAAPEEDAGDEGVSTELREVFALEAEDHLRELSTLLPALERRPDDMGLLQDIRRSAHTLKGSAAMVGFKAITQLAHRMEDLLDLLYEGSRTATPEIVQLLYVSTDGLEDLVTGKAGASPLHEIYARYEQLLGTPAEEEIVAAVDSAEASVSVSLEPAFAAPAGRSLVPAAARENEAAGGAETRRQGQFVRFPIERLDDLVKLLGELVITRTFLEQRMADLVRQVSELEHSSNRLRQVSSRLETQYEASTLSAGRPALAGAPGGGAGNGYGYNGGNGYGNGNGNSYSLPLSSHTHGFDDLEFDRYTEFHLLTRSLSETTSDIQTIAGELSSLIGDFDGNLNRQARLSSEVEDKLMRSRMVPLATLASRLHRTVRNVANQQGKHVDLVLEGEGTELDKTVLEEMADPLLHLLRNSVDHGIEAPEVRRAIGKPERGTIHLRADYVGSQVVIQISDDGGGLAPDLLRATAVARGFASTADAAKMSNTELFALVYLPGFSTAQQISEVSGRGVGLDIVKANVYKLKGTIALESQPGQGASFTIRLPMTMAVMRSILVKSNQETFAIPLGAVRQILRLDEDEMQWVGQEPVVRVADLVYPLLSLGKLLNLKQPADEAVTRRPILLLDVGAKQVAIMVDELVGGREIVIKNLGNHLRRVPNVMGATLMGDGSVVLILDPVELVREAADTKTAARPPLPAPVTTARETWSIYVVDDSPSVRRVLTNLVKNAGWKPTTAKDGLEALEILHHTAAVPDLILLDVEMPRMDGYELLATLKAHEAYRGIPVVMVTSRAGDKHRRKALDLGASGYVVKPYQDEALLNVIRHLVRESRSRQVVHS